LYCCPEGYFDIFNVVFILFELDAFIGIKMVLLDCASCPLALPYKAYPGLKLVSL